MVPGMAERGFRAAELRRLTLIKESRQADAAAAAEALRGPARHERRRCTAEGLASAIGRRLTFRRATTLTMVEREASKGVTSHG